MLGKKVQSHKRLTPEARRQQLMDAAIVCYGELGVERAGHGDIAKRVGVSTATVFNYFGTRENLTEAVFARVYEIFRNMFADLPAPDLTSVERMEHMTESYALLVQTYPDVVKVALNWSSAFGDSVRPQYLEFQDWILDGIQQRLPENRPDLSDARIILATAYNYARMKLDHTPEDVLERFVDRIVKVLVWAPQTDKPAGVSVGPPKT